MLENNKKDVRIIIYLTLIMYPIAYLMFFGSSTLIIILAMGVVTMAGVITIIPMVISDKADQKALQEGQRIRDNIKKMVEGAHSVEWQYANRYHVYTDKALYVVEYGEEESKLIYLGEHKTINMEEIK